MNKGALICFLGIDGSGKTTLARQLSIILQKKGVRSTYVWWLEGEDALIRRFLRKIKNPKTKESKSIDALLPNDTLLFRGFRAIVLITYLFQGCKIHIKRRLGLTIVSDRYIYDTLMALLEKVDSDSIKNKKMLTSIASLFPKPDLIIFIDIAPDTAYARRIGETLSVEHAALQRHRYLSLLSVIRSNIGSKRIVMLSGDSSIDNNMKEVLNHAYELYRH